ncbi:MAG: hypothetical protein DI598_02235 [Pseudopedobacter saltans]|uniref:Carrier domain-containing protein n=1 Tax=Pseudopedobacter saltans TaxID=151895 RepID=A0A2W5HDN7_9SPHI|nr:MAG: hypothetical protein DI598_02235 [Pseudopedobacter saltans]
MKKHKPATEDSKGSGSKKAAVVLMDNKKAPSSKNLKKTSPKKEVSSKTPTTKTSTSKVEAPIKKLQVKKVKENSNQVSLKKASSAKSKKADELLEKTAKKAIASVPKTPKVSSKNTAPMGNIAPAAFSKAAFEEQVNLAIRESIARQKDVNRVYDPAITDKMKSIIANYTESPELLENIENNTNEHFVEELNIDSVDFVEIIVDAEEAFQIKMEDDEIKALRSFDDLYDLIEGKINERDIAKAKKA